jgi:hypothetical protein
MNCEQVQDVFVAIARQEGVDEALSTQAHAHAQDCPRCAAFWADSRTLGEDLEVLAAEDREKLAPAHLEGALRIEFRQGRRAALRRRAFARWSAGAAAAACLLLAGGAATRWILVRSAARTDKVAVMPAQQMAGVVESSSDGQADLTEFTAQLNAWENAKKAHELTTDFFPFSSGVDSAPLEEATLIRVRLPRAAMSSYGFIVPEERAAEWVNADVVLGEDGQPRAIRFVR